MAKEYNFSPEHEKNIREGFNKLDEKFGIENISSKVTLDGIYKEFEGEVFPVHQSSLILSPVKNIKLALVYAFSIGAAIVPTSKVIVTAFNENTKEIMIAEGSLSPSDKILHEVFGIKNYKKG